MRKRWTAALLALVLAAALLPAPARADQADPSAGARLTGVDREVYGQLKKEIVKIAKGTRTGTEITLNNLSGLRWTIKELGAGNDRDDILAKMQDKLAQALDLDRVYDCLAADLPYELFWRDNQFSWGYSMSREGDTVSVKSVTIRLQVSRDYRGGSAVTTDPARIAAANRAAENAGAIVKQYRDCSDYEKLTAYREEICRLTSYNEEAASRADYPYGDPWQLVYVFDGDPDTKVVCEGYAKAFQYLCDLSDFSGDVTCRTVSGYMNGGLHMWNVVRMGDGQDYLVDVTNCDAGMSGADDKLFLSGAASSDGGRTHTVSKDACRGTYTYWETQEDLFTDGYLELSTGDYEDRPPVDIIVAPPEFTPPEPSGGKPAFTDVPEEAYYAEAVAWAVEKAITNGTTDTTFSPGQDCTQAQILTFLWRALEEPEGNGLLTIPGVADAYRGAILWADSMGIIDQSEFDPDRACTRATAVAYIWLALDSPDAPPSSFTDVDGDAPYAQAVAWAVEKEVTHGATDDTFDPGGVCSRGQIAAFLYRACH